MKQPFRIVLFLATLLLSLFAMPVVALAQEPGAVADALTSGIVGPAIGAAMVLVAWIVARIKHGIPVLEQLKSALDGMVPFLPPSLLAGGGALMAGGTWKVAGAVTLGALLTASNLAKAPPAPPAPKG